MPLQATHLLRSGPAEHTATAAGYRSSCLSCPHLLPSLSREMLVHELRDEARLALEPSTADRALAERGEEGAVLGASPLYRQPSLCRRSDVSVGVAGRLMAPFMPDVLLFERLVPDRGVTVERTADGDVERHLVVDLVGARIDLRVVNINLVRVELQRSFPLLRMPMLVQNSRASQAGHLAVVGEASRERREVSIVEAQPVTAKAPWSVSESVDDLKVVEALDNAAMDVPGDV